MPPDAPPPLELDERQPAYRVFGVAFALLTAYLLAAAALGRFPGAWERAGTGALALVAGALAVGFARSPWRLRTVVDRARRAVEHTAYGPFSHTTTSIPFDRVAAVELSLDAPARVRVVDRDGRRYDVLRPLARRGARDDTAATLRGRAAALAAALGTTVRAPAG